MYTCSICDETLNVTIDAAQQNSSCSTQCGHVFHHRCIKSWLERSMTCPQCRKTVSENHLIKLFLQIDHRPVTKEELNSLRDQLNEKDISYASSISGLENQFQNLNHTVEQNNDSIKYLEFEWSSHQTKINTLEGQYGKLNKDQLSERDIANVSSIPELKNQLQQINQTAEQSNKSIKCLEYESYNHKTKIYAIEDRIAKLEKLRSEIVGLKEELADFQNRYNFLNSGTIELPRTSKSPEKTENVKSSNRGQNDSKSDKDKPKLQFNVPASKSEKTVMNLSFVYNNPQVVKSNLPLVPLIHLSNQSSKQDTTCQVQNFSEILTSKLGVPKSIGEQSANVMQFGAPKTVNNLNHQCSPSTSNMKIGAKDFSMIFSKDSKSSSTLGCSNKSSTKSIKPVKFVFGASKSDSESSTEPKSVVLGSKIIQNKQKISFLKEEDSVWSDNSPKNDADNEKSAPKLQFDVLPISMFGISNADQTISQFITPVGQSAAKKESKLNFGSRTIENKSRASVPHSFCAMVNNEQTPIMQFGLSKVNGEQSTSKLQLQVTEEFIKSMSTLFDNTNKFSKSTKSTEPVKFVFGATKSDSESKTEPKSMVLGSKIIQNKQKVGFLKEENNVWSDNSPKNDADINKSTAKLQFDELPISIIGTSTVDQRVPQFINPFNSFASKPKDEPYDAASSSFSLSSSKTGSLHRDYIPQNFGDNQAFQFDTVQKTNKLKVQFSIPTVRSPSVPFRPFCFEGNYNPSFGNFSSSQLSQLGSMTSQAASTKSKVTRRKILTPSSKCVSNTNLQITKLDDFNAFTLLPFHFD